MPSGEMMLLPCSSSGRLLRVWRCRSGDRSSSMLTMSAPACEGGIRSAGGGDQLAVRVLRGGGCLSSDPAVRPEGRVASVAGTAPAPVDSQSGLYLRTVRVLSSSFP